MGLDNLWNGLIDALSVIRPFRVIIKFFDEPVLVAPPTPRGRRADPIRNPRYLNCFILLILYFIGIGSIVTGASNINQCPAEKRLPMCMLFLGVVMMVSRLMNCIYDFRGFCKKECDEDEDTPPDLVLINLIFWLVEIGIFIAVCWYTLSLRPTFVQNYPDLDKNYCPYSFYQTSFYGCIIGIIFYGLLIFLIACRKTCIYCNNRRGYQKI